MDSKTKRITMNETGYYYFGARYYDPMRSVWTTSDPAMSEYFDDVSKGEGCVYNPINLNGYHYANNNPIVYNDPDGEVANWVIGAIIGFATSVASEVGNRMSEGQSFKEALINTFTNEKSLAVIGVSTVIGAATSAVTTAAIKGEEIDLNSISEQTINAYKTGLVLNVISQGLSSINPNLPESVSSIIENIFPAIYEIRNSFN